jgi:hypothetical protein
VSGLALAIALAGGSDPDPAQAQQPRSAIYLPRLAHGVEPRLRLAAQLGGTRYGLVQEDRWAYAMVGPRLVVLDLADPARPRRVGESAPVPGWYIWGMRLTAHQDHVYVLVNERYASRLVVFNVSDRSQPRLVAALMINVGPSDLAVVGDTLVITADEALEVLDISVPDRPRLAAPVPQERDMREVAVWSRGPLLVLASQRVLVGATSGLPLDIYASDAPGTLRHVSSLVLETALWGSSTLLPAEPLSGYGDLLLVRGREVVAIVDLADPATPRYAGLVGLIDRVRAIDSDGERLYMVVEDTQAWEIVLYEVAVDSQDPARWTRRELDRWPREVWVEGGLGQGRLLLAPRDEPEGGSSLLVHGLPGDSPAAGVAVTLAALPGTGPMRREGDRLYVVSAAGWVEIEPGRGCDRQWLHVLDLAADGEIRPRGGTLLPLGFAAGTCEQVRFAVSQRHVYVLNSEGLVVLDATDPAHIRRVGLLADLPTGDLVADGERLYHSTCGRLQVVDLHRPAQPGLAGSVDLCLGPQALAAGRGRLVGIGACTQVGMWGQNGPYCLVTVDIRDPHAPRIAGRLEILPAFLGIFDARIALDGNIAWAQAPCIYRCVEDEELTNPIRAVDVSDLSRPRLLGQVWDQDLMGLLAARDGLLITSFRWGTPRAYDARDLAAPRVMPSPLMDAGVAVLASGRVIMSGTDGVASWLVDR